MLRRKHPKKLREERKALKRRMDIAEQEVIDSLAQNIAIEIDKEILDHLKKLNEEKENTS